MDRRSWGGDWIFRQVAISDLILKLAVWEISLADVKWEATRKRHHANCGRDVRTKITKRQMAMNDIDSARRKTVRKTTHLFSHK